MVRQHSANFLHSTSHVGLNLWSEDQREKGESDTVHNVSNHGATFQSTLKCITITSLPPVQFCRIILLATNLTTLDWEGMVLLAELFVTGSVLHA